MNPPETVTTDLGKWEAIFSEKTDGLAISSSSVRGADGSVTSAAGDVIEEDAVMHDIFAGGILFIPSGLMYLICAQMCQIRTCPRRPPPPVFNPITFLLLPAFQLMKIYIPRCVGAGIPRYDHE